MADQTTPPTPGKVQDPATSYERAKPEKEAGAGRQDNNQAVPVLSPDQMPDAVKNRQDPTRRINAEDQTNARLQSGPSRQQPDHSMLDEEPLSEDTAPQDIHDPRFQRHPRREGKGGTP